MTKRVLGTMPNGNDVGYIVECSLPMSWDKTGKNTHGFGPEYDLERRFESPNWCEAGHQKGQRGCALCEKL